MPRGRRHRSSSSRSRPRSISWSRSRSRTPRSVKKKYRDSYDSPYYKHSYSTERAERSRVHERGTSAERRYKRSHRRSPTSRRRHRHHRRRSSKHKDSYDSRSPTAEVSQLLKRLLILRLLNFFSPDFDAYFVLFSPSLSPFPLSIPFSSLSFSSFSSISSFIERFLSFLLCQVPCFCFAEIINSVVRKWTCQVPLSHLLIFLLRFPLCSIFVSNCFLKSFRRFFQPISICTRF